MKQIRKIISCGILAFLVLLCNVLPPSLLKPLADTMSSWLNWVTSKIPFSLMPIYIVAFLIMVVSLVVQLFRLRWIPAVTTALTTALTMYIVFFMCYGINYRLPPVLEGLPYQRGDYQAEDMANTTKKIVDSVNKYAQDIQRDESGVVVFRDFMQQNKVINQGYKSLMDKYNFTNHSYIGRIKQAGVLSVPMSYFNIAGVYFPFTAEANVSTDMVPTHIPSVMAHEQAHALGVAREDEANFIGFLAAMETGDPEVCYSALLEAYTYMSNALYTENNELWQGAVGELNLDSRGDLERLNTHLKQYETPAKDFGDKVNDAFIKQSGQPEGIKSYGLMVDLLISYFS